MCKYALRVWLFSSLLLVIFCSQSKLKGASDILGSTLAALASAVQQWDSTTQQSENQSSSLQLSAYEAVSPESVSELFHKAEVLCPAYDARFWERLGSEVAAAHQEIATVRRSLEADSSTIYGNRDQRHELEMLSDLSQVCVHVGVVLSQLLLPTDVDPVSIAEIEYNCYQLLVSMLVSCICSLYIMYITFYFV